MSSKKSRAARRRRRVRERKRKKFLRIQRMAANMEKSILRHPTKHLLPRIGNPILYAGFDPT